ncbi:hypothetical protein Tco_0401242 [Tanacetum coccineum]
MGLWYPKDSGFELTAFSNADHAGCLDTRKSTFGGIQFLGDKLLQDYGFNYNKIPLYCDSQSAIAISCNPVQHSRTKHIHTRYHFIKEQVENGIIELYFVRTEYQLADMFTKALPEERFQYLVRRIGKECRIRLKLTLEQSNNGVSNDVLAETGSILMLSESLNVDADIEVEYGPSDPMAQPSAIQKPCQGDSLNLPDHRIHKDGDGDASFQLKSDSLPHAHAQTTKTFYKHQDSRIMKAQELNDKDFRTNS